MSKRTNNQTNLFFFGIALFFVVVAVISEGRATCLSKETKNQLAEIRKILKQELFQAHLVDVKQQEQIEQITETMVSHR